MALGFGVYDSNTIYSEWTLCCFKVTLSCAKFTIATSKVMFEEL